MLDLKFVRENFAEAERRLATRGGAIDLSRLFRPGYKPA